MMTQGRATAIALHPGPHRKRECEQAERYIVRNFTEDDEERRLYKKIRTYHGYPLWDWLRQMLSRAYK